MQWFINVTSSLTVFFLYCLFTYSLYCMEDSVTFVVNTFEKIVTEHVYTVTISKKCCSFSRNRTFSSTFLSIPITLSHLTRFNHNNLPCWIRFTLNRKRYAACEKLKHNSQTHTISIANSEIEFHSHNSLLQGLSHQFRISVHRLCQR